MAFGVLDTAMTGHAGSIDLAIMALSISIYITVFVGLMGVMHALIPIQAQHVGAGELDKVGHIWGQGVWVSLVLSVVGGAVMMFPDVWLSYSGDVDPRSARRNKKLSSSTDLRTASCAHVPDGLRTRERRFSTQAHHGD